MKSFRIWFYAIALVILGAVCLVASSGDYWTSGYDSATGYSPWRVNSSKNLLPGVTNTSSVGESSYRASNLYSVLGNFTGTVTGVAWSGSGAVSGTTITGSGAVSGVGNINYSGVYVSSGTATDTGAAKCKSWGVCAAAPTSQANGDTYVSTTNYIMYIATNTTTNSWQAVGGQS